MVAKTMHVGDAGRSASWSQLGRRGTAVAAVAAALLVSVGDASAARSDGWSAPETVAAPAALKFDVGLTDRNAAVAVWLDATPREMGDLWPGEVRTATRSAQGTWSSPTTLWRSRFEDVRAGVPRVALNATGDAAAIWEEYSPEGYAVPLVAMRGDKGTWSDPVNLRPRAGGEWAQRPLIGMDASGAAVAVWGVEDMGGGSVVEAATRPVRGPWSAPQRLSAYERHGAVWPSLAVADSGDAVALWSQTFYGELPGGGESAVGAGIHATTRLRGGDWSMRAPLTPFERGIWAQFPAVATNADGDAVATWRLHRDADGAAVVQATTRSRDGTWSPPETLGPGAARRQYESAWPSAVALDQRGGAVAAWVDDSGDGAVVLAATRACRGRWSTVKRLSAPGVTALDVETDARGDAVVAWTRGGAFNSGGVVEAATRRRRGRWSAPQVVSGADVAQHIALAANRRGDAIVTWIRHRVLEAAVVDLTPGRYGVAAGQRLIRSSMWSRTQSSP